jgi:hypothetical protein
MSSLYELRNQATHGGALKAKSAKPVGQIVEEGCELYVRLVQRLLSIRNKPDWKLLELGPET